MVVDVAVLVGADVGVEEPEFAVLNQAVGVFQVGEAAADGFGLSSGKNNPALKFFQQEVVMGSDPINGGIALSGGGGLALRGFLCAGLGLMRGLAGHGLGFILTVGFGLRLSGVRLRCQSRAAKTRSLDDLHLDDPDLGEVRV